MLSPTLLKELREHWRRLRRKPSEWLFPGNRNHTNDKPISTKVVWHACRNAAKRAGIQKQVHPHRLRHCFSLLRLRLHQQHKQPRKTRAAYHEQAGWFRRNDQAGTPRRHGGQFPISVFRKCHEDRAHRLARQ